MPRSGPPSYLYSLPAVYLAVPGTTIIAAQHNDPLEDIASTFNSFQPVVWGGTGAGTAAGARTNLGLVIGVDIVGTDTANVFTAANTFRMSDDGAAEGPVLTLDRLSTTPAASDLIGAIPFTGRDSTAVATTYAKIFARIDDATDTTEDGSLVLQAMVNGTLTTIGTLNASGAALTAAVLGTPLLPDSGGTGLATLTANNVLIGNGTGNVTFVAPGSSGNLLTSNGTVWASSAPAAGYATITNSQQPTSNVASVTSTGFSTCKSVTGWFAFTHSSASALTYTIQGRLSAGTWRDIFSFTALADSSSSIGGQFTISNFNVAAEKLSKYSAYTNSNVLDDSNATNNITTSAADGVAYIARNEIWDEVQIIANSGTPIEGGTADQRGRWFIMGWP